MKEPAAATAQKSTSAASRGCLTGLSVLLLGLGYVLYSPATPPKDGLLVDAEARTYLEAEPNVRGFRNPDPYWSVDIYYTRLGGWFSDTKRVYWTSIPTDIRAQEAYQKVPPLIFRRLPSRPDSVLRISLKCTPCAAAAAGRVDTVFEKPSVFPSTGYRP